MNEGNHRIDLLNDWYSTFFACDDKFLRSRIRGHALNRMSLRRAVANGPVGPAMAGPIIEPVTFFFFVFNLFSGRTNNRASHFDVCNLFKTDSP